MNLFEAFGLNKGDIIAVTGGGGKTSLMYALGREAQALGLRPVLTTTTKILPPTDAGYALLVENEPEALTLLIQEELSSGSQLVIGSGIAGDGKLLGMDCSVIPLLSAGGVGLVVVEADGSAGRPFKAPGPHEPVVPPASTHVVTVVGIDCLGRPLLPEYIHRPELVERLTGLRLGQPVTPQVVARVLTHPEGYGRQLPQGCRRLVFLNKLESPDHYKLAREIVGFIAEESRNFGTYGPGCWVVLGSIHGIAQGADPVSQVVKLGGSGE